MCAGNQRLCTNAVSGMLLCPAGLWVWVLPSPQLTLNGISFGSSEAEHMSACLRKAQVVQVFLCQSQKTQLMWLLLFTELGCLRGKAECEVQDMFE